MLWPCKSMSLMLCGGFSVIPRPLPPPIFDCFQHVADVHRSNVAKVQYQLAACVDQCRGFGTAAAATTMDTLGFIFDK